MSEMSSSENPEFCLPILRGSKAFWVAVDEITHHVRSKLYAVAHLHHMRNMVILELTLLCCLRIIILIHWEDRWNSRR